MPKRKSDPLVSLVLDQFRRDYEAGDRFALHGAFLLCRQGNPTFPLPVWVNDALVVLFEKDWSSRAATRRRETKLRRLLRDLARFETVLWFKKHDGNLDIALRRAALAFNKGESNLRKNYKLCRKKYRSYDPPRRLGWTPAELQEGPSARALAIAIAAHLD